MKRDIRSNSANSRCGFTLLEVIIATAVLLGSITVLFQLISIGQRSSTQGQFRSDAVLIAETKMNEAVAGVIELNSTTEEDVADYPGWLWSMTVDDTGLDGLLQVTIIVRRDAPTTQAAAQHEYSMTRYLRDPQLFLDAAMEGS
jgi:type II secretion system protein I